MKRRFSELKDGNRKFIGTGIMIPAAEMVEIAGYANFDFVIIDEEHTEFESETAISLVRAAEAADIIPIIRVPEGTETYIKKALDAGASGIVVPNITSKKLAEEAVYYANFAPQGGRGACPCVRANQYGKGDNSYYENANRDKSIIALVEGVEGIKNFDEIISVPGLDAVYIGPCDLSMSIGFNGDMYHPEVVAAMEKLIKKAKAKGLCVGTFCMEIDDAKKWMDKGVDFIDFSTDTVMLFEKCKAITDELLRQ